MNERRSPGWRFLFRHPAHFFAFGFGSGLAPVAPGTAGSLAAIPLYFLLAALLPMPWLLALVALLFAIGVWFCEVTGKALGVADHGGIVWDEMVAMWLVLAFTPRAWAWIAAAFLLFRLFDVWKPQPIRTLDARVPGGFGVMLDDLLAAAYALAVLKMLQFAFV